MPKKITQQEFISRARSVHGEKYDYAKVSLINTATPVVIICPEHGEFCIRPQKHLAGQGCKKCGYNRNRQTLRKTTTWFVEKATQVHNGKYDYSQAVYVGAEDDIDIICPNHGIFLQRPNDHLQDKGCPKCKAEKAKSPICGVGINDVIGGQKEYAYKVWSNMIRRCYSQKWKEKYKAYNDCSVCDEWFNYSAFRAWFNSEYQDGYELDKDILAHGNRVYSPTTCLLVPREINSMLISHRALRGRYPIGVYKRGNKYAAALSKRLTGGRICLGAFDTPETAFAAYKQEKEAYIKEVASAYYDQGKITEKVYAALMKYRVEITD